MYCYNSNEFKTTYNSIYQNAKKEIKIDTPLN